MGKLREKKITVNSEPGAAVSRQFRAFCAQYERSLPADLKGQEKLASDLLEYIQYGGTVYGRIPISEAKAALQAYLRLPAVVKIRKARLAEERAEEKARMARIARLKKARAEFADRVAEIVEKAKEFATRQDRLEIEDLGRDFARASVSEETFHAAKVAFLKAVSELEGSHYEDHFHGDGLWSD